VEAKIRNVCVLLTVALTAALLTACALAPLVAPTPPGVLGYAECTPEGPRAWVRLDVLAHEELRAVAAHEIMHVRQMNRFRDCASYHAWVARNRLHAEAEAFCASAQQHPAGLTAGITHYARWLSTGYPNLRLSVDSARTLIAGHCGLP
jgi:hypothetical protein